MLHDPGYTIAWSTKAIVAGALAYFVMPLDAVSDFIPLAGYIDDASVIAWAVHRVRREIANYEAHKRAAIDKDRST